MTSVPSGHDGQLVCDLSALSPSERSRHRELWGRVREIGSVTEGGGKGVAFRMPKDRDLTRELSELAALEQLCCPFLRISVTLEPKGGQLLLELTGDDDVQAFLSGVGLRS